MRRLPDCEAGAILKQRHNGLPVSCEQPSGLLKTRRDSMLMIPECLHLHMQQLQGGLPSPCDAAMCMAANPIAARTSMYLQSAGRGKAISPPHALCQLHALQAGGSLAIVHAACTSCCMVHCACCTMHPSPHLWKPWLSSTWALTSSAGPAAMLTYASSAKSALMQSGCTVPMSALQNAKL